MIIQKAVAQMEQKDALELLKNLNEALESADTKIIERAANKIGIGILLSDTFLSLSKAVGLNKTTLFLLTLAVENKVNEECNNLSLGLNKYIIGYSSEFLGKKDTLLFHVASAIKFKFSLDTSLIKRSNTHDLLKAFYLCLEHNNYDNAITLVIALKKHAIMQEGLYQLLDFVELKHSLMPKIVNWPLVVKFYQEVIFLFQVNSIKKRKLEPLYVRIAEFAVKAHEYQICDLYLRKLPSDSNWRISRYFIQASCDAHRNNYSNSIKNLNLAIIEHCRCNFENNMKKRISTHSEAKNFSVSNAAEALKDLIEALSPIGIKPFLVSGTLLGYARNRSVLAHDKDIDVGVFGWDNQFEIVDRLLQSKKFLLDINILRGKKSYSLPIIHLPTKIGLDIFFYHEVDGKYVTGVNSRFGHTQTFSFSKFAVTQTDFLGVQVNIPENYELNLEENYGPHWREPDSGYISHLESPSTMEKSEDIYRLVTRFLLIQALQKADLLKVKRIINIALSNNDNDFQNGCLRSSIEKLVVIVQQNEAA